MGATASKSKSNRAQEHSGQLNGNGHKPQKGNALSGELRRRSVQYMATETGTAQKDDSNRDVAGSLPTDYIAFHSNHGIKPTGTHAPHGLRTGESCEACIHLALQVWMMNSALPRSTRTVGWSLIRLGGATARSPLRIYIW